MRRDKAAEKNVHLTIYSDVLRGIEYSSLKLKIQRLVGTPTVARDLSKFRFEGNWSWSVRDIMRGKVRYCLAIRKTMNYKPDRLIGWPMWGFHRRIGICVHVCWNENVNFTGITMQKKCVSVQKNKDFVIWSSINFLVLVFFIYSYV